jgi:hypothetical protein
MNTTAAFVRRIFGTPGSRNTKELLEEAASAHADLLLHARDAADPVVDHTIAPLVEFLRRAPPPHEKRSLLCHPLLIEGLHSLAPFCSALRRWHGTVTSPLAPEAPDPSIPAAKASLGNVSLAILLRADPHWQGDQDLCADALGRLGFPFCNWSLMLLGEKNEFIATRAVKLSVGSDQACWRLADGGEPPFLIMSRADFLQMIVGNTSQLEGRRLMCPNPHVKPRLQWASPLLHSTIRYDPIGFQDFENHAPLTGGLIEQLLAAIRRNSPEVYHEIQTFIHSIRGFELPALAQGAIASFSDPTVPGVMGINIPYTQKHEPCADACCFTWFGHELGHTKDYLIDNVLYARGESFLHNAADQTSILPRYGRSLSVRTLFQIPYVHLYEWTLLMDFWERRFRNLPWRVAVDVDAVGEDLAAEIEEAFALIEEYAQLTHLGLAALLHFRRLYALAQARWRSVRSRMTRTTVKTRAKLQLPRTEHAAQASASKMSTPRKQV